MNKLTVAGMGPGSGEYIVPRVWECAKEAEYIITSKRYAHFFDKSKVRIFENTGQALEMTEELLKKADVLAAVSGTPLVYSLYRSLKERISGCRVEVIPGIGSADMLAARLGLSAEKAALISLHGRGIKEGEAARTVYENELTLFLCDKKHNPAYIKELLKKFGPAQVRIFYGSELSAENEKIEEITQKEISDFPGLCVTAALNPNPQQISKAEMIPDSCFVRNAVPMTKGEIRAVVMMKLDLKHSDTVWDIGAGTGSVSAECARRAPFGEVHSVDCSEAAAEVMKKNKELFGCSNMKIYKKELTEALNILPKPDKVFIGGGADKLDEILNRLKEFHSDIRLVMTAVTEETQAGGFKALKNEKDFSMLDIEIGECENIGRKHIMKKRNKIRIISCTV